MATEKPSVLIVGGLGYIGRFLALHIQKNDLASEVRLVDKVLPQLAWLAPEFDEACSGDKFVQADATRERTYPQLLELPFFRDSALDTPFPPPPCAIGSAPVSIVPVLTRALLRFRGLTADIRPSRRQRVGLCLQLWGRDEILPGGRGLQGAVVGAVAGPGERSCETQGEVLRRAEHRHGIQVGFFAE
jgi:hypothetical protein